MKKYYDSAKKWAKSKKIKDIHGKTAGYRGTSSNYRAGGYVSSRAMVSIWKKYRPWTALQIMQNGTKAQTMSFVKNWKGGGWMVQFSDGSKMST